MREGIALCNRAELYWIIGPVMARRQAQSVAILLNTSTQGTK